ncbi:hypothetical protein GOODEAATRI_000394 [Goodea atripinnis]|uniref:Lethal giant larvae homologue 2 domain-containing protein n=1 Tax=Goodea atripinnis TaxID=208336 RepID=A0ABV0PJL5_9TELE
MLCCNTVSFLVSANVSSRITYCHLPFQSKWLYIGSERGNIHIVNVESFTLSGYVIMWNKAIELSTKTHPGPVVHISDNPMDEGKAIHSVAWHHEGKQFVCSHSDGTLTTWNIRAPAKPAQIITPHGRSCRRVHSCCVYTQLGLDPFMVVFGGLSYDTVGRRACLTVMHGKSTAVLEMDYPIVDFLTLCETPYPNVLYKLKTAKVFERTRGKEEKPNTDIVDEDPFAIQTLFWCPESRMLCVAGVSAHVIIYRFSKQEVTTDVVQCEFGEVDSPDPGGEQTPTLPTSAASSSPQEAEPPNQLSAGINSSEGPRDNIPCLQVRSSPLKQSPGYQVELVVQLVWVSGEPPQQITSLAVNSSFGLVVFGNSNGLAVVDYVQKTLLLHMGTSELYSPSDPCQRQPCSPRKPRQPSGGELRSTNYTRPCDSNDGSNNSEDRCKSPTSGSTSPCNSDDERKQNFIEKVKFKSRRFSKTVANDFAKMSRKISSSGEQKPELDGKDNAFTRSRSSSVTSIDRESREVISSFYFCESFPRKSDSLVSPCLLVGTTQGSVMMVALSLPPGSEQKVLQAVSFATCGTLVRLKGGILTMALLDGGGTLLPPSYEPWYDPNASDEEKEKVRRRRPATPPSSQESQDTQFAVLCSEKQAKVVGMPSQTRIYKHNITETSFVLRADVVQTGGAYCIACFCANGHIMTLRYLLCLLQLLLLCSFNISDQISHLSLSSM